MKYFFLRDWERNSAVVAYTQEAPPISYELIPKLEGKNILPFELVLKSIKIGKSGLIIEEILTESKIAWLDYLPNCLAWPLMSEKMKTIINNNLTGKEDIDWILAEINAIKERRNYYFPRFKRKLDVLDLQRTTFVPGTDQIIKPCFSSQKVANYNVFHKPISHYSWKIPSSIYVSETIKNAIESEGLTGVGFDEVSVSK
ncbi:hypothetical protein H6802_00105 [Candidatus Nomurabacteria bacterium]|nr:hypothetical protein [Candidatus Nomurabacteria bacterium]